MTSTFTVNTNLNLQGTGDNVGTWGGILNTQVFTIIDAVFGNVQTLTLSSSDITVTTTQSQVATIILTGTLTANVNVIFPAIGRTYFVINNCTGAFTTTLKIGAGATAISPQGAGQFFVLDGTNVNRTTTPGFGALTSVASAATVNLGAVGSNLISITGTTAITSFGSSALLSAPLYELTFTGSVMLTYNATSMILLGGQNIATAAGDAAVALYLGSGNWRVLDYTRATLAPNTGVVGGAINGLILSNDVVTPASVLDIASGQARDSTNVDNIVLAAAFTKNTSAIFAAGTGNGSLDSGVVANGTYHVFVIMRQDTRQVDILTSLSPTGPSLPTNYTLFRRIGSIIRASGAIRPFIQDGNFFYWNAASLTADISISSPRAKSALTVAVPTGIRVEGIFQLLLNNDNNTTLSTWDLYDGANPNIVKRLGAGGNYYSTSTAFCANQFTNISAQIQAAYAQPSPAGASSTTSITTLGFVDSRIS